MTTGFAWHTTSSSRALTRAAAPWPHPSPVAIDGAAGEGGGQILRTSLALSLVTGRTFRMVNIRAKRAKPGLLRQHLTAVRAAVEVSDAACVGAEIGSGELVFRPGAVRVGDYRFAIGTAGSTTLVLQTILPALALASGPSQIILEGGTHNPLAPPFDFLTRTFLPVFNRFRPTVEATLICAGFYPAGGGQMQVKIMPTDQLRAVELLARGKDKGRRVVAYVAGVPPSAAERAFEQTDKRLRWGCEACEIIEHSTERGQGFVLVGEVVSEVHTEVSPASVSAASGPKPSRTGWSIRSVLILLPGCLWGNTSPINYCSQWHWRLGGRSVRRVSHPMPGRTWRSSKPFCQSASKSPNSEPAALRFA